MRVFKDSEGVLWQIDISAYTLKRVKQSTGVALGFVWEQELYAKLRDAAVLVDVLFVVCEKQVQERKLTDETFARRLRGEVLPAATNALLWGLHDFLPGKQQTAFAEFLNRLAAAEKLRDEAIEAAMSEGKTT